MDPSKSKSFIQSSSGFANRVEFDQTPLVVEPDVALSQVLIWMSQEKNNQIVDKVVKAPQSTSYCLVMSQEQLLGIFTERDVVKIIAQGIALDSVAVTEVMTCNPITIAVTELEQPFEVVARFKRHRVRHLPVLDDYGQLLGVVTHASLRQSLQATDLLRLRRIHEVMSTQVVTALPGAYLLSVVGLMATHRVSCVVVAEASDDANVQKPIGIITERDIVKLQAQNLELSELSAAAVMSAPLECVVPQDTLWNIHKQMQAMGVRRLVVAENNILVGIVTQTRRRKSTRLNSSHPSRSRMPSSA